MQHSNLTPTVSIALCTYNGALHLREQLDSLFAQTFTNFEIVAHDDASTDSTADILREYSKRDARLRLNVNKKNIGVRRNFESTLKACQGDLIAPADQDDIWLPGKLETLVSRIEGKALAYCDSELIDANGRLLGIRISDKVNMLTTDDPTPFIFSNCVSGHALLVRREVVERALPIPEVFMYDWWLAAVAATRGGIQFEDRCLVHYRQHEATVTDFTGARKRQRVPDRRLARAAANRKIEERLAALAALDGRHQARLVHLLELWRARNEQWFSLEFGEFVFRNRNLLYAIPKKSAWQVAIKAARKIIGRKLGMLFYGT